jgi:hypothetical protein
LLYSLGGSWFGGSPNDFGNTRKTRKKKKKLSDAMLRKGIEEVFETILQVPAPIISNKSRLESTSAQPSNNRR